MPKNYNIVTKQRFVQGGAAAAKADQRKAFGSSVAAGMTRYVTMVRVEQHKATGVATAASKVYLCSTAASATASTTAAASTAAKLIMWIHSGNASHGISRRIQMPDVPDVQNPLFTIAASKFFTCYIGSVATTSAPVHVFVQYYDQ